MNYADSLKYVLDVLDREHGPLSDVIDKMEDELRQHRNRFNTLSRVRDELRRAVVFAKNLNPKEDS